MFNIMNIIRAWRKKRRAKRVLHYKNVGEAIDDNPDCRFIVIATLYEEDIYLGSIVCMPLSLRDRPVIRGLVDDETLLLLT